MMISGLKLFIELSMIGKLNLFSVVDIFTHRDALRRLLEKLGFDGIYPQIETLSSPR